MLTVEEVKSTAVYEIFEMPLKKYRISSPPYSIHFYKPAEADISKDKYITTWHPKHCITPSFSPVVLNFALSSQMLPEDNQVIAKYGTLCVSDGILTIYKFQKRITKEQ